MFRKLKGKKKGQNTAEYAILISLVVAAVIAMQTYVQRGLQSRMRGAVREYLVGETAELGDTVQYEPYYLETNFNVLRESEQVVRLDNGLTGQFGTANITREDEGFQKFGYGTGYSEGGSGLIANGI